MILYYITDRSGFPGSERERVRQLLGKIAEAAQAGVDYIQLREKDLSARAIAELAAEVLRVIRENSLSRQAATRLLINSRVDVALATGAEGVHLPSYDLPPADVREIWKRSGIARPKSPVITAACHSVAEVAEAAHGGANLAVFAPVFEKLGTTGVGLDALSQACRQPIPVIALGGITTENARLCPKAGAAGIAAIRLFQENDIREIAATLSGVSL